jgi:uncharacterized membrane protein (UPF0127 family)
VSTPTKLVLLLREGGVVLADRVGRASRSWQRARGLIGRPPLARGDALVLEPAAQVHTVGMRYAIDVVFCDEQGSVLHVVRRMRPWRITRWVRGARYAVELPSGALPLEVAPGAVLVEETAR